MILRADARLLPLRDACVQTCVTSPPYWGLRDYGVSGQIGLEPSPDAYVAQIVAVFREVRRVLRDDGTLWLNLGSSYWGNPGGPQGSTGDRATCTFTANARAYERGNGPSLSRVGRRAPACGTDGTTPLDSTGAGSACSDLCDECLADFLSHRDRTAGSGQPTGRSEPQPCTTGRDSGLTDCASASPGALLPDAPVSTTIESWRQHRGECSRCRNRAASLSVLRSSDDDAPAFARMTWLDYTRKLKHKDMVPTPWMVAFALQADGWYLRQDIIWHKPGVMPESVKDRCTRAHEYLFLLTKQARYYWDAAAMQEPGVVKAGTRAAKGSNVRSQLKDVNGRPPEYWEYTGTRNRRSVWSINTKPYTGAHFATFPPALVEPCVLAGSRPGDLVLDPFLGSGTVGRVATSLGRRFVGCDLNAEYLALARERTQVTRGLPLEASA